MTLYEYIKIMYSRVFNNNYENLTTCPVAACIMVHMVKKVVNIVRTHTDTGISIACVTCTHIMQLLSNNASSASECIYHLLL